jgi:hypothetical protein
MEGIVFWRHRMNMPLERIIFAMEAEDLSILDLESIKTIRYLRSLRALQPGNPHRSQSV